MDAAKWPDPFADGGGVDFGERLVYPIGSRAVGAPPPPTHDYVYLLGEATRRPLTLDEYAILRGAIRGASEQAAPPLDQQRLNDEYLRGYRAAAAMVKGIEAIERAAAPPLDVERLRRAFRWMPDLADGTPDGRPDFDATAAAYDRLGSAPSRSAPSDSWRDTGNRGAAEHAARTGGAPSRSDPEPPE